MGWLVWASHWLAKAEFQFETSSQGYQNRPPEAGCWLASVKLTSLNK